MTNLSDFQQKMMTLASNVVLRLNEPLSRHTSFRIGGPARRMAFPRNSEQLVLLLNFAVQCGARPYIMGNGTNLLFPDGQVDRLIVNTRDMDGIELTGEGHIRAGAGASLARVANFACQQSLTGLEFAHGIPGSVGGAVCMNAGAYGGEMAQVIEGVSVLFPEEGVKYIPCHAMDFGYRRSLLTDHPDAVALYAVFALQKGDAAAIRGRMEDLMARRKASQPLEYPSAGSTFKRPVGQFAGKLIEDCGLRGFRVGGAAISEKHCGFVVNLGNATCADVVSLTEQVRQIVLEKTGCTLEREIRVVE